MNRRKSTVLLLLCSFVFLTAVTVIGCLCSEAALVTDFSQKNLLPGLRHPFGTDWLGRDMFARTMKGMSLSIMIGVAASAVSSAAALCLGTAAAVLGKKTDAVISYVIDLVMGIPHMLLLILISLALGKGLKGVVVGIALTHWTSLARLIRAEVLKLKESQYVQMSVRLGHGWLQIAVRHMLPHLIPQFMVGLLLMFPHAILHESGVTFLGFGLPAGQPAIGVILSESMRYLITGKWWLAVFPGVMLSVTVILFDVAGESLKKLMDPASAHQ